MAEPESLVLAILREMRTEMKDMRAEMATKNDFADLRSEMNSRFADVASDMMDIDKRLVDLEKHLGDRIATLNRAVMEYHSSTIGHGILYSDIDDRVRRIEQHLKLDAS